MVFHLVTFYFPCVIRIMPPLTLADLRLRSIHRKKGAIRIKFCRNRLTHCIYVVCIQCLIYTMMTPFDKRNMREISDFFPICRYISNSMTQERRLPFHSEFSAPGSSAACSIAGVVPHAALTNPSLSATFFDTILSFSIRARN